ncbi:flotillin-like FloA family protein [bacterium]|nr:flotillin-like FloA family protein [bacterium]
MNPLPLAAQDMPTVVHIIALLIGAVFVIFPIVLIYLGIKWFKAAKSGDPAAMQGLVGRLLGKTKFGPILQAVLRLKQAGITISNEALGQHAQAGGSVPRVVDWLIAAKSAGLTVPFEQLCKLDLQGELPDMESAMGLDPAQLAAALQKD